ncbi:hypothetical protein [Sphingopyxis flava]|uniref:Uncharacterized protein n=1 Tax=Sphingopyxis flava TaxID=1507287 RepID=A0A1T5CSF6_9SPHN|nr:hypothetical protein [Sphingopyxis flava]SKB62412.1 hypothetical protein SAMN06295937_101177 [Sphingopyxis flava]
MTTRVTIDAHAGWPVEVTLREGEPDYPKSAKVVIVRPGGQQDFYIHSGLEILGIREMKRAEGG